MDEGGFHPARISHVPQSRCFRQFRDRSCSKRRFAGVRNSYSVRMQSRARSEPIEIFGRRAGESLKRLAPTAVLAVLCFAGCQKPDVVRLYPSQDNGLSYRVDDYRGKGALAASSTAVFAVLQTKDGHTEKLVLSGTYLELNSISWKTNNEGSICLAGGYTATYRRIVALSVGSKTVAVYTHLSDGC